jgi:hypothetical protein
MSYILSLKQAISLDQAAEYLSSIASEAVTSSDLLELALHEKLTLSITMPGNYWAYPYNKSASKKAGRVYKQLENKQGAPVYRAVLLAQFEYTSFCIRDKNDENNKLGPDFLDGRSISGIWDLSMLGMERELVTELAGSFQNNKLTFAGSKGLDNNKPVILKHPKENDLLVGLFSDEEWSSLNSEFDEIDTTENPEVETGLFLIGFSVRKVQQFPAGSFLVIRTENLQKFVSQIIENPQVDNQEATVNSNQDAPPIAADTESEIKRLQRAVAGLALGLMNKYPAYRNGDKPNISKLTDLATDHLRSEHDDRPKRGFGKSTINDTLKAALESYRDLNE